MHPLIRIALQTGIKAAFTGTLGSLATAVALGLFARAEGRRAVQPINATSHWLHGEEAARVRRADLAHTGVGLATHHASAMFWAVPFQFLLRWMGLRSPGGIVAAAAATAGFAALVDYGLVPKRLTPGWEEAVSRRSVASTFAVLALSLAAGALLTRPGRGGR